MGATLDKPIVCPVLVGRAEQVEALARCLDEARAGAGQTVLVAGEAGIGKSRLIAEARDRAAAAGCLILQGNCFEPDRTLPYAPVLDLLRAFLADRPADEVARLLGPTAPEITRLLPEWADLVPGSERAAALDPAQEKQRLFRALCLVVVRLAEAQPVLLVVEDLHWADDTSLEWLLVLARRLASRPILLLLSCREEEMAPGLAHLAAELERARLAAVLRPPPLTVAQAAEMVRLSLGLQRRSLFAQHRLLRPDVVRAIHELTEGNPFFIEEVLRSLGAAEGAAVAGAAVALDDLAVPRSVHDAVQRRLATLSNEALRVLDLAAVAGRRFDFELLRDLTGLNETELLGRIKEAIAAHLVVEESAERFAFRHALTRQAVYSRLLARERLELHRAIAERLEKADGSKFDTSPGNLAYHFYEAGDWPKAIVFSQVGAERALAVGASSAAIAHVNHALLATAHLPPAPAPALYRMRGVAYETLGDFSRARADFQAALDLARAQGDRLAEWQALLDLGSLSTGHDYEVAGHFLRAAAGLARGFPDRVPHALSLNRLGNWHVNTGRIDEAVPLHRQALDIFEMSGDQRGTAETLDLLGMAHGLGGDPRASVRYYDRAIARFRDFGDRRGLLTALAGRIVWTYGGHFAETTVSPSSDPDALRADVTEALVLAGALDWPAMESFVHLAAGPNLEAFGSIGEGQAHLREALRIAREIGHQQWLVATQLHLSHLYRTLFHTDLALRAAEEGLAGARALGSTFWIAVGVSFLGLAHLADRHPDRAEAILASIPHPLDPPSTVAERLLAWTWGELARATGDATTAIRVADALLASLPGGLSDQPIPALAMLKGEALLTLGRADDAAEALTTAKRGAIERSALAMQWRIQGSLARVLEAAGHREQAAHEAADAHALVDTLAASVGDEILRRHFRRAAHATLPGTPTARPRRPPEPSFGSLTAREHEVALLLAKRLTNREIAEALFVGERTVETHVANILGKLRCASRAEAAAWLGEHGIADST